MASLKEDCIFVNGKPSDWELKKILDYFPEQWTISRIDYYEGSMVRAYEVENDYIFHFREKSDPIRVYGLSKILVSEDEE